MQARALFAAGFRDLKALLLAPEEAVEEALVQALPQNMRPSKQPKQAKGGRGSKLCNGVDGGLTGSRSINMLLKRMTTSLLAGGSPCRHGLCIVQGLNDSFLLHELVVCDAK